MKNSILIFIILIWVSHLFAQNNIQTETKEDLQKYYTEYQVTGSFVLFDKAANKYIVYNQPQLTKPYTPASTFKICNSMIGLETGVIPDENYVIPWDSVERNPVWDADHDLKTAYKHSTVWYYQELARRVGADTMKYWLKKTEYGNSDISGGVDLFWLTGGLRVTPLEQIDFLTRLYLNKLPFSQRSMDITRHIMVDTDTLDYTIYGKTGWGSQEDEEIGWFVGYVEKGSHVLFFANCVQMKSEDLQEIDDAIRFDQSRKQIVYKILSEMNLIAKPESE